MKNQLITIGILALGTAGIILLRPGKISISEAKKKVMELKCKVKIEPEKLGCC